MQSNIGVLSFNCIAIDNDKHYTYCWKSQAGYENQVKVKHTKAD